MIYYVLKFTRNAEEEQKKAIEEGEEDQSESSEEEEQNQQEDEVPLIYGHEGDPSIKGKQIEEEHQIDIQPATVEQ